MVCRAFLLDRGITQSESLRSRKPMASTTFPQRGSLEKFAGKIHAIEVCNEPNNDFQSKWEELEGQRQAALDYERVKYASHSQTLHFGCHWNRRHQKEIEKGSYDEGLAAGTGNRLSRT